MKSIFNIPTKEEIIAAIPEGDITKESVYGGMTELQLFLSLFHSDEIKNNYRHLLYTKAFEMANPKFMVQCTTQPITLEMRMSKVRVILNQIIKEARKLGRNVDEDL